MKHPFFKVCLTALPLIIFLLCSLYPAGALELEIKGGANLLSFDPDLKHAYSGNISDESDPDYDSKKLKFKPYLYPIGSIILRDELNENLAYSFIIDRDNILHNSISGLLISKSDYFSFGFGPFLRITDSFKKPFIGILSEVNLQYPGVVFLNLTGSITLKDEFESLSKDSSSAYSAKLGFWLPSVIPFVSASFKKLTREINDDLSTEDTFTRYQAGVDIYAKNFPLVIKLDAGYQIHSRLYREIAVRERDELKSVFAGFEVSWQLRNNLKLIIGAEVPVSVMPKKPMTAPAFYTMPKATTGVVFTF